MKPVYFWLFTALAVQGLAACAHQGAALTPSQTDIPAPAAASAQALTQYHWQLQHDLDSGKQATLRLDFADGAVLASGLCNTMRGSYSTEGTQIKIGKIAGTLKMCPDESLMKLEQAVAQRLETATSFNIADVDIHSPVLTLGFGDAQQWQLAGTPTPETRFGTAGVTVFLEVQPTLAPCHHPLIPDMQCMQVRTIEYDEAGLKRGQGEWQLFYGDIEGYTHTPGVRNILRVKRYARTNVPADTSSHAYVLDMVVESEQILR